MPRETELQTASSSVRCLIVMALCLEFGPCPASSKCSRALTTMLLYTHTGRELPQSSHSAHNSVIQCRYTWLKRIAKPPAPTPLLQCIVSLPSPPSSIELGLCVQQLVDDRSLSSYLVRVLVIRTILFPQQNSEHFDRRVEIEPLRALPTLQSSDSCAWLDGAHRVSRAVVE